MTVTIIVPVYNVEDLLPETLESILSQTHRNWLCFLINDGSTDNSQRVIEFYCKKDARFCGINKVNERSADLARRFALEFVETEWVMNVDGDDVIDPDYLYKMLQRQRETSADIVISRFVGCKDGIKGINYLKPSKEYDMDKMLSGKQVFLDNIGGWTTSFAGALYRKCLTEGVYFGPYMNSDELSQRLIEYNAELVAFCDTHYFYRNNIGTSRQISARMFDRTLVDIELEQYVKKFFPDRIDKMKAIVWQRLFNLIYLVGDYVFHKREFTLVEQKAIRNILVKSYNSINRNAVRQVAPRHFLMLMLPFDAFTLLASLYVRTKRVRGGSFYYR